MKLHPRSHLWRRPVETVAMAVAACWTVGCSGLATNASRGMQVIPAGAALRPAAVERSSFSVPLHALDGGPIEETGQARGSAVLSMRPDNVLEYQIQIANSGRDTFTQAQVVRVARDSTLDVIATLFADVMMRGSRISVRGTASLSRSLPPDELLARIREHPEEYRVMVRGDHHPAGSLAGRLGAR